VQVPKPISVSVHSNRMRTARRLGYATIVAEPRLPAKLLRTIATSPRHTARHSPEPAIQTGE